MIYTYSRNTIEAGITQEQPYVLISEGTHVPARLPADAMRMRLMRLQFHDIELHDVGTNRWTKDSVDLRLASQYVLYSTEDARRVSAFVRAWPYDLVIHCDGGISRSQGMANAIADHLDADVKHSCAAVEAGPDVAGTLSECDAAWETGA